ncbi:MAG: DUF2125 domain-containing protein [Pseudomonadota bacterium]
MSASPSFRASRLALVLPFIGLAIVFAALSVYWLVVRNGVETAFTDWRASQARLGATVTCGEERFAGYPFRIEVVCRDAVLETGDAPAIRAQLGSLVAVAQVYNLRHIILEANGPFALEGAAPDGALGAPLGPGLGPIQLDWDTARASLRFQIEDDLATLERGSLVLETLRGTALVAGAQQTFGAARTEVHILQKSDASVTRLAYDLALRAQDAAGGVVEPNTALWQGAMDAVAFDLPPFATDMGTFLRTWAVQDGSLGVTRLEITNGTQTMTGSGTLKAAIDGRLQGDLSVGLGGIESSGGDDAALPAILAPLAIVLSFIGTPVTINEAPGRQIDLSIRDGVVSAGLYPVVTIPPLF